MSIRTRCKPWQASLKVEAEKLDHGCVSSQDNSLASSSRRKKKITCEQGVNVDIWMVLILCVSFPPKLIGPVSLLMLCWAAG
jgi:hypothetical protein